MASREDFDLLGDLGRSSTGESFWLGRERMTGQLVALQVRAETGHSGRDTVEVVRALGEGVPAGERRCYACTHHVPDWRRYCSRCGADLGGAVRDLAPADLNSLLAEAARQNLDVLGQMRCADGGGAVYFGRERNTQEIVALSLRHAATADGPVTLERTAFTTATIRSPTPMPQPATGQPATGGEGVPTPTQKICPVCGEYYGADIRFCSRDGAALEALEKNADLVGQVVADRYLVLRKLGQGGMAQVFLAEHVRMGRRCALKILNRHGPDHASLTGRFTREAANASRINHPNVATIYDFGETPDRLIYLAMEYIEGETLGALIRRSRTLPYERARDITLEICAALTAAHRQNVVHRDLKPDNILVGYDDDGRSFVKVVDFGIAKALGATTNTLTQTGFVVGTPQYMSPEQLIAEQVDVRTDIYSLGCVLYEMLTGETPFAESEGALKLTRRLTEPAPDPRTREPGIPGPLAGVVAKALARSPDDRFQNAAEMREVLRQIELGAHAAAKPVAVPAAIASRTPIAAQDPPVRVRPKEKPAKTPVADEPRHNVYAHQGPPPERGIIARITPLQRALLAASVVIVLATTAFLLIPDPPAPQTPPPPPPAVPVLTGVALTSTSGGAVELLTLTEGERTGVIAHRIFNDGTRRNDSVSWRSSNAAVASVDLSGVITAIANGTARIIARADTIERTVTVTVQQRAVAPVVPEAEPVREPEPPPPPREPGVLTLRVLPFARTVVIDSVRRTEFTFGEMTLPDGRHRLRIDHPTLPPFDTMIVIRPGEKKTLRIDLRGRTQ